MAASVVASTVICAHSTRVQRQQRRQQRVASLAPNRVVAYAAARPTHHTHSRWVAARAADDAEETADDAAAAAAEGEEEEDDESPEARIGSAMAEFADAGYPSEEGDVKDPVSRTRAMNGAVDDINALMDSETEVLNQAFDLLEQMGLKAVNRPSKAAAEDGEEVEEEEEKKEA